MFNSLFFFFPPICESSNNLSSARATHKEHKYVAIPWRAICMYSWDCQEQ